MSKGKNNSDIKQMLILAAGEHYRKEIKLLDRTVHSFLYDDCKCDDDWVRLMYTVGFNVMSRYFTMKCCGHVTWKGHSYYLGTPSDVDAILDDMFNSTEDSEANAIRAISPQNYGIIKARTYLERSKHLDSL